MDSGSQVELPVGVGPPFEVFVNGIPKRPGVDFEQRGRTLVFAEELRTEGRLGFWRWFSIILGVAGTYRRDDKVDVIYQSSAGRTVVTLTPVERADVGDGS